jgi:hypothetical protein
MARTISRVARATTVALAVAGPIAVADAANAVPIVCDVKGQTTYTTTATPTDTITHLKGYQLGPGTSITTSRTATFVKQLNAGITVTSGATVSADTILAKAEVSAGVSLAASAEVTTTSSVSVSATIAASNTDRYYAAYQTKRSWSGTWKKTVCQLTYISTSTGTWHSFSAVELEGFPLCPASRYPSGSIAYKACKGTWG